MDRFEPPAPVPQPSRGSIVGYYPVRRAITSSTNCMPSPMIDRRTMWQAIGSGALSGAFVGLLVGLFLAWLDWIDSTVDSGSPIITGLIVGAVIGAVIGLVGYLLRFTNRVSTTSLRASRFRIEADDPATAAMAVDRLAGGAAARDAGTPQRRATSSSHTA